MSTKVMVGMFGNGIDIQTKLGTHRVYEIDNPSQLPKNVKMMIMDSFYPVALTAFNQNQSEAFQNDVYDHLFNVDALVLAFNDNVEYGNGNRMVDRGIAFRTYSEFEANGFKCAYIEGTAVDPNYQGYGFYQGFTKATINGKYDYIVSRTQNPVVITALNNVFGRVSPITGLPDDDEKEVAWKLCQRLKMEDKFDRNKLVGKGVYGKSLNGLKPRIDNQISKVVWATINPEEGDCLIAVCKN